MLDLIADALRCLDHVPIVKMGVAGRGPNIGMAKQLTDHRQGFRMGGGMAGKAVPQIVDANAGQPRLVAQLASQIADIGCGSGGQTMILAQNSPGTITGLDLCLPARPTADISNL